NGQGSVTVAPSNAFDAVVTLTDAADNESLPTPVTLPDSLAPDAPEVTVGEDGLTLDIDGEPGATAKVYDGNGDLIGTVVLDGDGQGTVVVPASEGGNAYVTQTDAANNVSPQTPVPLPNTFIPDALEMVADAAVLQHTVTEQTEAEPSMDEKSETSVLDLSLLGDLVDLDLGS